MISDTFDSFTKRKLLSLLLLDTSKLNFISTNSRSALHLHSVGFAIAIAVAAAKGPQPVVALDTDFHFHGSHRACLSLSLSQ